MPVSAPSQAESGVRPMRRGYTITPTMNAWLVAPDGDFSQIDALGLECPLWVKSGHRSTSAQCPLLPPKADIHQRDWHVRFVPKADISSIREQDGYHGIF